MPVPPNNLIATGEQESAGLIYKTTHISTPQLCQGEIITGLKQFHITRETIGAEEVDVDEQVHPYAIIVSQDCDLEQDYKIRYVPGTIQRETDKVTNILFCEVQEAVVLKGRYEDTAINSHVWGNIKTNTNERYHFLQKIPPSFDALGLGLPELGINFRRYFTVPTAEVYKQIELGLAKRRTVMVSPYLEHLSARFGNYLTRIALPQNHSSDSAA